MITSEFRKRLLASSIISAAAMFGMPTLAQVSATASAAPSTSAASAAPAPGPAANTEADTIVVTGTLFRRSNTETASPVTTVTEADLQARGIQTVQAAIQQLASANGPALTNAFTANGAFASGASGISLRGLTTNSTLTLFDGLRAAYYPLADDGVRNFVDLNTIPDEIVDHIEVLRDGASSTYGADAVAGVVNIITKKQVVGLHAIAEAGISERGDTANQRLSATYGYGDLADKGFNFYVSAHYVHSDALEMKDRDYPYNSSNRSGICYQGNCGPNNIDNGSTNGTVNSFSTRPAVFLVRPYNGAPIVNADGTINGPNTIPLGRYQLLNPAAGCGPYSTPFALNAADYARLTSAPATVCQQDRNFTDGVLLPELTRYGASAKLTVRPFGNSEAYAEFNYEESKSFTTGTSIQVRALAPTGIDFPQFRNDTGANVLTLPVYVCPQRVNCNATNGILNPNNPFAALGEPARLIGRLSTGREESGTDSQVFRGAVGIRGSFGGDWNYSVEGVAMVNNLTTTSNGYGYIQHLIDVVNDGTYNFLTPSANSAALQNYLTPTQINKSSSELYQAQASLTHDFFTLPGGGHLQVAVGGAIRYESVDNPSGNPDYNGPTNRYFVLNAFGAVGHRYVYSGYYEVQAPLFHVLELSTGGRYDNYSSGQDNFSPKFGIKLTPIKQFALRGTFSRGFRIPSFAESNSLPTTGYVSIQPSQLPPGFVAQHLGPDGKPNDYLTNYSLGETTVGTQGLKPEKSRSYTIGAILKPVRNVNFTLDYYNIKKTQAITAADFTPAINAYYAGQPIPAGYTVTPDVEDPSLPAGSTAARRLAFVSAGFVNANSIETSGFELGLRADFNLGHGIHYSTNGDAAYIIKLNTTFSDGHTEHYAGTLGNFNLTAGSGTPRWKAIWTNTLDYGVASLSATTYYTDGYNLSAEDQGGVAGDCGLNSGYQACDVKAFVSVDLTGSIKVNKQATFYVNVYNVADAHPPLDTATYSAGTNGAPYNSVVAESGIIGRAFRAGVRLDF